MTILNKIMARALFLLFNLPVIQGTIKIHTHTHILQTSRYVLTRMKAHMIFDTEGESGLSQADEAEKDDWCCM